MPREKTEVERLAPPSAGAMVARIQAALDALVREYAASFEALEHLEAEGGSPHVSVTVRQEGFCYVLTRFPTDPESLLTCREWDVVTLAAKGDQNKEIAHRIGIKQATVAAHLRNVYSKWGVASRGELVHKFYSLGGKPR